MFLVFFIITLSCAELLRQREHSVLDLGFKSLQENFASQSAEPLSQWEGSKALQHEFVNALAETLVSDLKGLKKDIGQTWVSLPPGRRDSFAQKLKSHITGLFADTTKSLRSRISRRVDLWKQYPPKSLELKDLTALCSDSIKRFESRLNDYYQLEARTAPLLNQEIMALVEVD